MNSALRYVFVFVRSGFLHSLTEKKSEQVLRTGSPLFDSPDSGGDANDKPPEFLPFLILEVPREEKSWEDCGIV